MTQDTRAALRAQPQHLLLHGGVQVISALQNVAQLSLAEREKAASTLAASLRGARARATATASAASWRDGDMGKGGLSSRGVVGGGLAPACWKEGVYRRSVAIHGAGSGHGAGPRPAALEWLWPKKKPVRTEL